MQWVRINPYSREQDMDAESATAAEPADAAKTLFGSSLAKEMPEVDLHAVNAANSEKQPKKQQETTPKQQKQTSETALTDGKGRLFNPLLHETTTDGQPVLKKDGKTIKCRRTPLKEYKQQSTVASEPAMETGSSIPDLTEEAQQPEPEPESDEKKQLMQQAGAVTCAGLQVHLMRMALGDHVATEQADKEALVACWNDVFNHYGMSQMHPIVGLSIVTGMVTVKALDKPEAASRWRKMTNWAKQKAYGYWLWMTAKTEPRKAKKEPQEDEASQHEPQ